MIKVVAKNYFQKGKIEEGIELYNQLIQETVKEEGCIKYELYQDINDPHVLTMIEEWDDLASLTSHEGTLHFIRIFPLLKEITEKNSDFHIYKRLS